MTTADRPSAELHPDETLATSTCEPCMDLLRKIDEDLRQWEEERAARRRRIITRVIAAVFGAGGFAGSDPVFGF